MQFVPKDCAEALPPEMHFSSTNAERNPGRVLKNTVVEDALKDALEFTKIAAATSDYLRSLYLCIDTHILYFLEFDESQHFPMSDSLGNKQQGMWKILERQRVLSQLFL